MIKSWLHRIRRAPIAFATLTVMLGCVVGLSTTAISVYYVVSRAALPYPDPQQLVAVGSGSTEITRRVSPGEFVSWRQYSRSFESLSALTIANVNVRVPGADPESMTAGVVTPGYFGGTLREPLAAGRDFLPSEEQRSNRFAVLLSHRLATRWFGGPERAVGRAIDVNGEAYEVVGVLRAGLFDRSFTQFWLPLAFRPEQLTNYHASFLQIVGRLRQDMTPELAREELAGFAPRLGIKSAGDPSSRLQVIALKKAVLGNAFASRTRLLMEAAVTLLLIASVNAAAILLLQSLARSSEVAVKVTLGATSWAICRDPVMDGAAIGICAGAVGGAFTWITLKLVQVSAAARLPPEVDLTLTTPVLVSAAGLALGVALCCGSIPAWSLARQAAHSILRPTGRSTIASAPTRVRSALVICEVALAAMLLGQTAVAVYHYALLAATHTGTHPDHLVTAYLPQPNNRFTSKAEIVAFYRRLLDAIGQWRDVRSATVSSGRPVEGLRFVRTVDIAEKPFAPPSSRPWVNVQTAAEGYFDSYGIHVVAGRRLTARDSATSVPVAMVNTAFVERYFQGRDPLAERLVLESIESPGLTSGEGLRQWQVVGVFSDVRNNGLHSPAQPEVLLSFWQSPWPQAFLALRTEGVAATLGSRISTLARTLDPALPATSIRTMDEIIDTAVQPERLEASIYMLYAAIGLVIAATGIFATVSFATRQQQREFAVRVALGAARGRVLLLVLGGGARLAGVGAAAGVAGSLLWRALVTASAVSYADVWLSLIAAGFLVLVATLACVVPATLVLSLNPSALLRE